MQPIWKVNGWVNRQVIQFKPVEILNGVWLRLTDDGLNAWSDMWPNLDYLFIQKILQENNFFIFELS